MRHLKVLGVALVAMFAVGITTLGMTASASAELALPEIHVLEETGKAETYPLWLVFADNGKTPTKLETSQGAVLEGTGVETLLELAKLGSLGAFKANFLNVVKGATKCSSTGAGEGEVRTTGEWHVVPLTTSPLADGIAFLLGSLVLITCGAEKVDVKGCALSTLNATENNKDLTEISGALATNGKGSALKREFLNNLPKFVKCILETELVGTKIVREGAESVNKGEAVTFGIETGSLAKMFLFLNL